MIEVKTGYEHIEVQSACTRISLTEFQAQALICQLEDAIVELQNRTTTTLQSK